MSLIGLHITKRCTGEKVVMSLRDLHNIFVGITKWHVKNSHLTFYLFIFAVVLAMQLIGFGMEGKYV